MSKQSEEMSKLSPEDQKIEIIRLNDESYKLYSGIFCDQIMSRFNLNYDGLFPFGTYGHQEMLELFIDDELKDIKKQVIQTMRYPITPKGNEPVTHWMPLPEVPSE